MTVPKTVIEARYAAVITPKIGALSEKIVCFLCPKFGGIYRFSHGERVPESGLLTFKCRLTETIDDVVSPLLHSRKRVNAVIRIGNVSCGGAKYGC